VPSRYTALASSQQDKVETRATSWSDEELAKMSAFGKAQRQLLTEQRDIQDIVPVEEEVEDQSALQGPTDAVHSQPELTDLENEKLADMSRLRGDTALNLEEPEIEQIPSPKLRQTPSKPQLPSSSTYRTGTRQVSLRRKTLTDRFTADAHEHSELSFVAPLPGDRMMSLSLSVSRPLSTRHPHHHQLAELQSSPSKVNSSYILSDLPDFTVHEEDAERPSERALATRLAHHAAAEVNDRYALAVKELVKTLTDVNEEEPYWEDLKSLDLHARSLASLYGLDEFCTHVQELDVSNNGLTHLHGTPWTTRRLRARSNQLSSLTSWNHLMNLQYLDVSNNQLDSLNGLGTLIHLRDLRADDNSIASLHGLFELDGLLKLRLRRNRLKHIDLEGSQFNHLTMLDLSNNYIATVHHLDKLQALEVLVLDRNSLKRDMRIDQDMPRLISLSMRNCNAQELDVSRFPNLKTLAVDGNYLSDISGISKLKNLLTLSMERQSLPADTRLSILDQSLEARTIRLSGTAISSLTLQTSFLSIRHLELASTGLHELPQDFGIRMPNLKTLNLNYNNLKDIRPILNIQNLEQLSVCGNRLHRLRKSVATFAKMMTLKSLDLRDNPLTQGFYASVAATVSRNMSLVRKDGSFDVEENDASIQEHSSEYTFLAADRDQDQKHLSRLDNDTKLRRRVYEMLLASSCKNLEVLDGLGLDRAATATKDTVWHRLVELGIVRRSQTSLMELG
jgi:Leucine-rich repeat (LRR) protein